MDNIPSDVFTTFIFLSLSRRDQISLLAAIPTLSCNINWQTIYNTKYDALSRQLLKIHDDFFTIRKSHRLKAIRYYYDNVVLSDTDSDYDINRESNVRIQNIPIVEPTSAYRLQDYLYEFEDYIYDEIEILKRTNLVKVNKN